MLLFSSKYMNTSTTEASKFSGNLSYAPPVIKNFGENYGEIFKIGARAVAPMDEWNDRHKGRFLFSALENTIRAWALGGAITHDQVLGSLNVEGLILGGGYISVNEDLTSLAVRGYSSFGSLPNSILVGYFRCFDDGISANMVEEEIRQPTRQWFSEHGVNI